MQATTGEHLLSAQTDRQRFTLRQMLAVAVRIVARRVHVGFKSWAHRARAMRDELWRRAEKQRRLRFTLSRLMDQRLTRAWRTWRDAHGRLGVTQLEAQRALLVQQLDQLAKTSAMQIAAAQGEAASALLRRTIEDGDTAQMAQQRETTRRVLVHLAKRTLWGGLRRWREWLEIQAEVRESRWREPLERAV